MKQKKDKDQKEREFERLVQEQRQTIYSVCYLFANDRQEADDLAQEVLIRLWQGIDSFEGRSSAKTWVYRVALNTCVTLDKRHRRRPDCMPLEMDIDLLPTRKPVLPPAVCTSASHGCTPSTAH